MMRSLELLAPAKNLECGIEAIKHGADAVYIGALKFGARVDAGNSIDDIRQLCEYAHVFSAKVYVTVNTIVYDDELNDLKGMVSKLKEIGVDALLVQDMGFLDMLSELGLPVHASTQTDNRTPGKVAWLKSLGFSRVVLARETSLEEIKAIHKKVPDMELEAFVHGALCVSLSGLCYASQYCFGRSANRGECAQFCRLKFNLLDSEKREIVHQSHLLSLKDLCLINHLEELADAGVCSFKIEGRLKDVDYVKNVVSSYSKKIDDIIRKRPSEYCRSSIGCVTYSFEPSLRKTFHRGYTTYFFNGRQKNIESFETPKAKGEYVGKVKEIRGRSFNVAGTTVFANGDGLCFFNDNHELEGFRVNKVENNRLYPLRMPESLRPGTVLYRNNDEAFKNVLSHNTAERKIPVTMQLDTTQDGFRLVVKAKQFTDGVSEISFEHQQAKKPQHENIVRQLTKLGDTVFVCLDVKMRDNCDDMFIPSSLLSDLRRSAIGQLKPKHENSVETVSENGGDDVQMWQREYADYPYLYNVANAKAHDFYSNHGKPDVANAFELDGSDYSEPLIMQCRHCLRYSLGRCVKHGGKVPEWKEPLYLQLADKRLFRLAFDCKNCIMKVYAVKND